MIARRFFPLLLAGVLAATVASGQTTTTRTNRLAATERVVIGGSTFGSTSPLQVVGLPSTLTGTIVVKDSSGNMGTPSTISGSYTLTGGLTLGGDIAVNGGDLTASGALLVSPVGDLTLNPGGLDVLPGSAYAVNLGSLTNKYLTLHAAELWVETLVAQNTLATIGGRILVGPTTTLTADLSTGGTSIVVKHNSLASGDRVYLEASGSVEFLAITSGPSGAGPYTYSVTRNLDGSGANAWTAGDAVFNTGQSGSGWIDLYSVRGVKSGTEVGPTIVGNVRQSSTYNDWAPRWAIGNLDGLYGYSGTTFGGAFGDGTAAHLTFDAVNGVRGRHGSTTKFQITPAGVATFSEDRVTINASGVTITPNGSASNDEKSAYKFSTSVATPAGFGLYAYDVSAGTERARQLQITNVSGNDDNVVSLIARSVTGIGTQYTAYLTLDGGDAVENTYTGRAELGANEFRVADAVGAVHSTFTSTGADLAGQPRLKWYRNATQSLTTATLTDVTFTTNVSGVTSGAWGTVDATPTIPRSGGYYVTCSVTFANNTTGIRKVVVKRGSTELARAELSPATGSDLPTVQASALVAATAGDTLSCAAYQNSGGSLDVYGSGEDNTSIQAVKVW